MANSSFRVLIIENSPEIVDMISFCLKLRWPNIEISNLETGESGIEFSRTNKVDFLILDRVIPDIDGLVLLQQVRTFSTVPCIMLVDNREEEQVQVLEAGADDCLAKPFRPRDFTARFNAVLRRCKANSMLVGEKYYTPKQIAAIFNVTSLKVRRWIQAGDLTAYEVNEQCRVKEADLLKFIERTKEAASRQPPSNHKSQ